MTSGKLFFGDFLLSLRGQTRSPPPCCDKSGASCSKLGSVGRGRRARGHSNKQKEAAADLAVDRFFPDKAGAKFLRVAFLDPGAAIRGRSANIFPASVWLTLVGKSGTSSSSAEKSRPRGTLVLFPRRRKKKEGNKCGFGKMP